MLSKEDLLKLDIKQAHEAMKSGKTTATLLAQAYLDVIKEKDGEIHAYLEVFDDVLEQARHAEEMFKNGSASLMTGIPVAIKDNILFAGKIASSGSKMLENYRASYDSTAVARLKKVGAVILGRTNMDEFAMGGSTENSAFGPTKNPHDTSRVPGGTSGGSAAAVAMRGALVALGTDTGGSVRQPACFCGVVGLKPTYGAVSRFGIMAAVSSFDQVGPLARTADDAKILFDVVSGQDVNDATTIPASFKAKLRGKNGKGIIGVPYHFLSGDGIDPKVYENFLASVERFKKLGYDVQEVNLPNISHALPVYYILNFAEISSNLARYDGVKYGFSKEGQTLLDDYVGTRGAGFGKEARRRIMLGAYVLSSGYYDAYYNKANALRRIITEDFHNAWKTVDFVLTPTTPAPAWKMGEKSSDPMAMYLADIFTITPNLTGLPAMSIPSGTVSVEDKNLPVGVQLVGMHGQEENMFACAADFTRESTS